MTDMDSERPPEISRSDGSNRASKYTMVAIKTLETLQAKIHQLESEIVDDNNTTNPPRSSAYLNVAEEIKAHIKELLERVTAVEAENDQLHKLLAASERHRETERTGLPGASSSTQHTPTIPLWGTGLSHPAKTARSTWNEAPRLPTALTYSRRPALPLEHAEPSLLPSPDLQSIADNSTSRDKSRNGYRSRTFLNKNATHDLTKKLPPANVQLPVLPLTDVECIVFFFNMTLRPIFAIRLYARNWSPQTITKVLNDHRRITPNGYQRNTCSVRLTTAIKRGRAAHGVHWEPQWRDYFASADDAQATDAIRLVGRELDEAQDYYVLDMLDNLIRFPTGKDAGLFTKAVQWCDRHTQNVQLSHLVKVAAALRTGIDPMECLHFTVNSGDEDEDEDGDKDGMDTDADGTDTNKGEHAGSQDTNKTARSRSNTISTGREAHSTRAQSDDADNTSEAVLVAEADVMESEQDDGD